MFRTARTAPTFGPLGVDATPQQVVERVAASRARARRRFRIEFVLTWLVLVGGLVVAIASTGRVKPDFIFEWAPFILGGVSITIFVSVTSIFFATLFAVIGALGRLSRVAPIYAAATLYVSLDPRHAADHPAVLLVSRPAPVRDRLAGARVRDLRRSPSTTART